MVDESEIVETMDVDLNETIEVKDATADSNIPVRPPERGFYPVRWTGNSSKGENGIVIARDINKRPFLSLHLKGNIIAEDTSFHNFPVTDYINTMVFSGKPTSDIHSFLNKLGSPVPNVISFADLKEHLINVLSNEPIGMIELDWKAGYKDSNSKTGWTEQYHHMEDFPKNEDGTYSNIGKSKKDGEPIFASAYVAKHVSPQRLISKL